MPRKRKTQPIRTPTGQPYGRAQQQEEAQRAVPLPQAGPPDIGAALTRAQEMAAPPSPLLAGPSRRPDEPVTAGLRSGPGPGPEVLAIVGAADPVTAFVRTAYSQFPNPALAAMLDILDATE